MIFKARDLLVRQKTRTINALRGHLAEFGIVAPKGTAHLDRLISHVEAADTSLPKPVCAVCLMLIDLVRTLIDQIRVRDADQCYRSFLDALAVEIRHAVFGDNVVDLAACGADAGAAEREFVGPACGR